MAGLADAITTGEHGKYRWVTTLHLDACDLDDLLTGCPQILHGRRIAITARDSGNWVTEEEVALGWEMRNGVVYSTPVIAVESIEWGDYDECYVFAGEPTDLGTRITGNPFLPENATRPYETHVALVNFTGWRLDCNLTSDGTLDQMFWKQMEWTQAESYLAQSGSWMTFVTENLALFDSALVTVRKCPPRQTAWEVLD